MTESVDFGLVLETIRRLLNSDVELNDVERRLVARAADDLEARDHRGLAEMAALSMHRVLLHKAVLHFLFDEWGSLAQSTARLADIAILSVETESNRDEMISLLKNELKGRVSNARTRAKSAADIRHAQSGAREKQQAVKRAWASGKYSSRDRCAEEECGGLGMSFATARKALRNTPDP